MMKDNSKDDSHHWPKSFKDGEFGWAPSVMLGGPIDGSRYRLPVLPNGGIPHGFGHPLQQPHETSPVAYYELAGDEMVGGYYVYFYCGTKEPGGRRVLAETPVIGTTSGNNGETCERYGSPQLSNSNSNSNSEERE